MRDPTDIVVLQTAIVGEADVLCTLDTDFYDAHTSAFCSMAGIEVCTDRELSARVAQD